MPYKIREWERYEPRRVDARSQEKAATYGLQWYRSFVRARAWGPGWRQMLELCKNSEGLFGEEVVPETVWGVFHKCCLELAGEVPADKRDGTLYDHHGEVAETADVLAKSVGFDPERVAAAMEILTDPSLAWIVYEPPESAHRGASRPAKKSSGAKRRGTARASLSLSPSLSSSLSPGPVRLPRERTAPVARSVPKTTGPERIPSDLTGPDRTAKKKSMATFVLELCQAFGLRGSAAVAQRKAFQAVWRRLSVPGVPEHYRAEFIALAAACASDTALDRPVAVWQKRVNAKLKG